jgi:hypothetical protein
MKNAAKFTWLVTASVMTDAKIGPTHGVHISPRLRPIKTPPPNPPWTPLTANLFEKREKKFFPSIPETEEAAN